MTGSSNLIFLKIPLVRDMGWRSIQRHGLTASEFNAKTTALYGILKQRQDWDERHISRAVRNCGIDLGSEELWARVVHRFLGHHKDIELTAVLFKSLPGEMIRAERGNSYRKKFENTFSRLGRILFAYDPQVVAEISNEMDFSFLMPLLFYQAQKDLPGVVNLLNQKNFPVDRINFVLSRMAADIIRRPMVAKIFEALPEKRLGEILSCRAPSIYLQRVLRNLSVERWQNIKKHIAPKMLRTYVYRRD